MLKGKQIKDGSVSLDKLKDAGKFELVNLENFQILGTASNPNDPVSFKDLDGLGTGGGSKLQIEDYKTGATFSDVKKMIFRGNTITSPGGEVDGVLAEGNDNTVTIWVPAPDYVDNFNRGDNSISNISTTNRYVADPSTNGNYDIGGWTVGSQKSSLNNSYKGQFSYTVSDFACLNENGDVSMIIYRADGSTILSEVSQVLNSSSGSITENGLSINVTSFNSDNDRFKASVEFTINLNSTSLIPDGGRFTVKLIHNNNGDSESPYEFTQTMMYDRDTKDGNSSANISGVVSMTEKVPNLKYLSGVAYYKGGSSFDIDVKGMDLLNEITYPTNGQLSLDFSNSSGISDDNNITNANFTGWDNIWDTSSVEYAKEHTIGGSNLTTPGLNNNNDLNASNKTSLTAKVHDWTKNVNSKKSNDYNWLILNKNGAPNRNTEPLTDESKRLKVKDLVVDGSVVSFDSQSDLTIGDYQYELQQVQGESDNGSTRLVYPKIDFKNWLPSVNNTTDYSTVTNQDLNIDVIINENGRVTQSEAYSGYRWYSRMFATGVDTSASTQANGTFAFNGNFNEADIDNGDLVMFMSVNSFPNTSTINKEWFDLTSPFTPNGRGCRSDKSNLNLDNPNQKIGWNVGSNITGSMVYLLIGIKDTKTDKRFTQIDIEGGNWD